MMLRHPRLHAVAALTLIGCFAGCSDDGNKKPDTHSAAEKHNDAEGAHPEEGPHKGHLIELGKEEYHAELLHDDAAHKVTIYLLDGKAAKAVTIADNEIGVNLVVAGKPQHFKLPAVPQPEDAAGQSSRFELTSQEFCDALDDEKTTGRLNLTIAGKPYAGEITHAGHDDHDHK
ncbi:MAG: hypothetical protein J0M17_05085 [Planctomycetes bacterium]|nr:hypothetical protein [Planctomycetota bacterium]